MYNPFHPHQSKGIEPAPQLVSHPRCPITDHLITPDCKRHIAAKDPETDITRSFYIAAEMHPAGVLPSDHRIDRWLAERGLERIQ